MAQLSRQNQQKEMDIRKCKCFENFRHKKSFARESFIRQRFCTGRLIVVNSADGIP